MLNSFIFSLNATVPVFAIIVVGNLLKRIGLIDISFSNIANRFVFKICLPCMLFQDLAATDIRHNFNVKFVGFCFFSTLLSIIVIWILAKLIIHDKTQVGSFVQCSYRSSAAILGIAFIQNIYGTSGMAPLMIIGAVPLYNIFAVVILTFESQSNQGKADKQKIKQSFINVLKNPIIIGIFLGMVASYFNMPQCEIFKKSINSLAVMTAPLALISIGAAFEGRAAIKKIKPTLVASFIKLIGLTAIFLPIAIGFGFRDQFLIAIVIMLASPCTPTSYVMAKTMDNDAVLASSIVVTTTLFSAVTLTFWIFLMKSLGLIL